MQRPSADSFSIVISPQDGLGLPPMATHGPPPPTTHVLDASFWEVFAALPRGGCLTLLTGNRDECTEGLARVASRTGAHDQGGW